jgi:hypothetical protein
MKRFSLYNPASSSAGASGTLRRTHTNPLRMHAIEDSCAKVRAVRLPQQRPNHSVKPTRSGLRPPRAAYLKR